MDTKIQSVYSYAEIDELVKRAVARFTKVGKIEDVTSVGAVASDGDAAVAILVVVGESVSLDDGDLALDIIVAVQQAFSEAGESRLPIVSFAKKSELKNDDSA